MGVGVGIEPGTVQILTIFEINLHKRCINDLQCMCISG